jgi:2-oxoglutarate ferredoxin oxidoreductase subunit alpha
VWEGGVVIHSISDLTLEGEQKKIIDEKKIKLLYIDAVKIAKDLGGSEIMANMVLVGLVWKILGLDLADIKSEITERFEDKPDLLCKDLECLEAGFNNPNTENVTFDIQLEKNKELSDSMIVTGNQATALGAISAGVRAYYAYPMTPASSILTYLASKQKETGMLIKQAEDEITAANMSIGSMYAGTRAFVATSGGGFDLMTESLSLAAMTETPWVCMISQRPGPATGVPTWTSASDLNLAVCAGHGEYPRIVIAASDAKSAYRVTQEAFNLAEKYQVPVLLLSEKQIAESLFDVNDMGEVVPIERHIVEDGKVRYEITDSGVSPRWIPGSSDSLYTANSDEHLEDGSSVEEAEPVKQMYKKRMRKEKTILDDLPEPEYFGDENPDVVFVGWGSVKSAVIDAMDVFQEVGLEEKVGYLHYEYIYPLKTDKLMDFVESGEKIILVENNYKGQLGELITQKTGYKFNEKLLKYDGRPFFVEDVVNYLTKTQ